MKVIFKKVASMFLTLTLIFSVAAIAPISVGAVETNSESVGETYTSGDFEYELVERYDGDTEQSYKVARITEYRGSDTDVIIPSEIDGYKVVAIDKLYYYENTDKIKSFTIPEGVSYIEDYVFKNYDNLENIFVNAQNEDYCDIDGVLFSLNNETKAPYSLIIYPRAKSNTTYQIPEGINNLEFAAFYECSNLINLNVPKSIESFPVVDFWDYKCWENNSVENINISSENETYSSVDGVLFNKDKTELILYPAGKRQANYSIPETVNEISEGAFYTANNLKSIEIPDSVVSISEEAFDYAENLSDIKISDSVSVIGADAFDNTSWYNNQEDGVIYINKCLYEYKGWMPENTSISIKDGTKSICDNAFSYCSNLINVEFPNSVTYIGEKAFYDCDSLIDVKLSENITYLGHNAFNACENLKSINIPEQLTKTGWNVFANCSNLETVYFNAIASNDDEDVSFDFVFENSVKTVIYGDKVTKVASDFNNNSNLERVVLGSNVKSIGSNAFSDCTSLASITIPDGVTEIDGYAFSGCTNLTSITIPESVTEIGDRAFENCTNLLGLQIPSNIEKIGDDAFDDTAWYNNQPDGLLYIGKVLYAYKGDRTKVTNVEIKEGTKAISNDVFSDCVNLKNVVIPDSVNSIGSSVFENCTSLESITIPNGVTSIGNKAFYGCTSLASIEIPDGVTSIGWSAFSKCISLKNAKLPSKSTGALLDTFSYCENLESTNIPDGIVALQSTFDGCKKLKNITIPKSVIEIYRRSFGDCMSIESITVPAETQLVVQDAFSGCTSLKNLTVENGSEYYYSVDGMLVAKKKYDNKLINELIYYAEGNTEENISIPSGTDIIGRVAFEGNKAIKSVDLPDSVTQIMYSAFANCSSLGYINIPDSVKSISSYGSGAFVNCPNLKCVTVPSSVERIGEYSFGYSSYFNKEEYRTELNPYDNFTIIGKTGTAAETYANENGFTFIDLDNKNYNYTDNNCGIGVIAKADAELVVEEISDKENLDKIKSLFDNNKSILNVYDITLSKNGKKVQHEGMAEVSIPCKDKNAKVYRVESDNTLTDMQAVYKDGYLKFYTEHFSDYVVASPRKSALGDINNDSEVNAKDRMMLTRYLAKWSGYENIDMTAADVNNDGEVNAKDRMVLTRHLAKWQGYETLPFDKF